MDTKAIGLHPAAAAWWSRTIILGLSFRLSGTACFSFLVLLGSCSCLATLPHIRPSHSDFAQESLKATTAGLSHRTKDQIHLEHPTLSQDSLFLSALDRSLHSNILTSRIAYTWASDRWRLPALYWMQRVEYPDLAPWSTEPTRQFQGSQFTERT